jgi:hypothetical protein
MKRPAILGSESAFAILSIIDMVMWNSLERIKNYLDILKSNGAEELL